MQSLPCFSWLELNMPWPGALTVPWLVNLGFHGLDRPDMHGMATSTLKCAVTNDTNVCPVPFPTHAETMLRKVLLCLFERVFPWFIFHIFRCLFMPFPGPEDVTVCKTVACTTFAETGTEKPTKCACAAYAIFRMLSKFPTKLSKAYCCAVYGSIAFCFADRRD